ncbi:MAG: GNAT family N-acetyltransferase [Bacteroidaceae bacterium]|nr:GNAT family N-acetyltransferase [Bacteroidaceae bacterium]
MLLSSERIILRAVEPEDIDTMYLVENDTRLWPDGLASVPFSAHALRRFISDSHSDIYRDGQLRLVIDGRDGITKGFIDLQDFEPRHLRAGVGVVLFPEWQGQGIATEALALLAEYAKTHLAMHQLYAVVATSNARALALFRRAGFRESGCLSGWLRRDGGFADACLLQYLCEG